MSFSTNVWSSTPFYQLWMSKSPITCHVLDSTLGRPGRGVEVHLEKLEGNGSFTTMAKGLVDSRLCRRPYHSDTNLHEARIVSTDIFTSLHNQFLLKISIGFHFFITSVTDDDGRCLTLLSPNSTLTGGIHRMSFETGAYFEKDKRQSFYPKVEVSTCFQFQDIRVIMLRRMYSTSSVLPTLGAAVTFPLTSLLCFLSPSSHYHNLKPISFTVLATNNRFYSQCPPLQILTTTSPCFFPLLLHNLPWIVIVRLKNDLAIQQETSFISSSQPTVWVFGMWDLRREAELLLLSPWMDRVYTRTPRLCHS